jgi:ParB family chromosome partitioning protein
VAKKKSRLGKGLGALLGDVKATTQITTDVASKATHSPPNSDLQNIADSEASVYREIPIEQLQRGKYQPRSYMDKEALSELAESIRSQGVIQPLLVRSIGKNQFEIIAGERRWRGAQLAELATVPAVVREIPDQAAMAVGLIENIQREDLNAMEEARGYHRLIEEFGLTHQEISEAVGCSRTAVSNLLRMLALHPVVQKMVESRLLDMGHARALLSLTMDLQPATANKVINKQLSVRQTEQLVKSITSARTVQKKPDKNRQTKSDIAHLQEDLSKRLGARVDIQHGSKKGKLVIHYHSLDELDGILEKIK